MPKIDANVANTARAWNYLVGGKDNFEADRRAARELVAAAPVISYLAVMHPASDLDPSLLEAERRWNQLAAQRVKLRSREQVAGYLIGLRLVAPGLVTVPEWRPAPDEAAPEETTPLYAAVARKP